MKVLVRFILFFAALFVAVSCTSSRYAGPAGTPTSYAQEAQVPTDRKVVYEADMEIHSDEPDSTLAQILDRMEAVGGYFVRKTTRSVTMRLPAADLVPFMDGLGGYGKVVERNVRGEDVTDAYADYGIRLETAEASRKRYLELLAKATTVAETLLVEKELERLTAEIELLKGRRARLDAREAYSLLRVDVAERVRPGPLGYVFKGLYEGVKWLFVWE